MIVRIQRDEPDRINIIEASLFADASGNTWKLTVTNDYIYIDYLGTERFRLERFVLKSNGGKEMSVSHDNLFSIEGSSFEDYYEVRDVLINDSTENVWKYLQWRIYNSPIGVFSET